MKPMSSDEDRFWSKVKIGDGCWEWVGTMSTPGYGKLWIKGKKYVSAHRLAWEFRHGEGSIGGLYVLHRCDNRLCVRPGHLFLGTHQDNMNDMVAKGRARSPVIMGEKNGSARLDPQKVREIRRLRENGNSYVEIAELYGVGETTVGSVCNGISWKSVGSC